MLERSEIRLTLLGSQLYCTLAESKMAYSSMFLVVLAAVLVVSTAQQVGTNTPENHPPVTVQTCTKSGGCQTQSKSVVIDSNWRWTHITSGYTNCYTGNEWDKNICPDGVTCAQKCALDGADYQGTYGVITSGSSVQLKFVTHGQYSNNVGSRLYLLDRGSIYVVVLL